MVAARTAEGQFGLLNLAQLQAAGYSFDMIRHRIAAGRLTRVLPTVYGFPGAPPSWERDLLAAQLWAGEQSAISHSPAAAMWHLEGFAPSGVEISVVGGRNNWGLPFKVHRVGPALLGDIALLGPISVTSVRRTLLDLAGVRHPRSERGLDHALIKHLTSLAEMWTLYEEEWTRGRRGIAILRAQLMDRTPDMAVSQSVLEMLYWNVVRTYELPHPVSQFPVDLFGETIHVDFAYPSVALIIECDGYAFHRDRQAFENDRDRDNKLRLLGWTVLRFTWAMLRFRPDEVAGMVRAHFDRSSA